MALKPVDPIQIQLQPTPSVIIQCCNQSIDFTNVTDVLINKVQQVCEQNASTGNNGATTTPKPGGSGNTGGTGTVASTGILFSFAGIDFTVQTTLLIIVLLFIAVFSLLFFRSPPRPTDVSDQIKKYLDANKK